MTLHGPNLLLLSTGFPKCQGLGFCSEQRGCQFLPSWSFYHLPAPAQAGASPFSQCLAFLITMTLLHVPLPGCDPLIFTNPIMMPRYLVQEPAFPSSPSCVATHLTVPPACWPLDPCSSLHMAPL